MTFSRNSRGDIKKEEEEGFGANKYASLAALNILLEDFQSVEELESLHPRMMRKKANDIKWQLRTYLSSSIGVILNCPGMPRQPRQPRHFAWAV